MRDGAVLLADRWSPKGGGDGLPIALIRTPYGRAGTLALGAAKPLVERGFQAVIVNARATFGSDGPFNPFLCEREDGLDVLDWVAKQPWAGESIVLVGASYVGYTQWSVADAVPPQVKAMVPVVSNATFTMAFNREGGFALETPFTWAVQVERQERRFANVRNALEERSPRSTPPSPTGTSMATSTTRPSTPTGATAGGGSSTPTARCLGTPCR
ncbi:CocE/NonD family hydrolase [Streptomyces mirabilis]|uniref:CocE/NonD family hydrolase n=1 Tax=Streptomyces mirabilis TaxID=68239 RepID=UPI0036D7BA69